MERDRLTAFSDGVFAIIITIMVLYLKIPQGSDLSALVPEIPDFFSYALSFVYVAIYWNNHHHMMNTVPRVSGPILWANTNLLFWLSLIPFATAWMGENHFASTPTAIYGVALFLPAIAYVVLQKTIIRFQGPDSLLAKALGRDIKGKISPLLYLTAILLAFIQPWLANLLYALVALIWLIPDRRIEDRVKTPKAG